MNYITEINAFERWLETNYLPISSQLLWYKLMFMFNKSGWSEWVTVDNLRLMAAMQMSREATFIKVRDELIKAGLIEYQKGKKGSPNKYKLISFTFKNVVQTEVNTVVQSEVETVVNTVAQTVDINKHRYKQNIKKDTNVSKEKIDYQEIIDLYNSICISFSRATTLSDARKKAIKARYANYKFDDFKTLFETAERSDFLKGRNNRNWMANFDWMIKDANMAKILDGYYANRSSKGGGQSDTRGNVKPDTDGLIQQAINAGYGDGEWEGF